MNHRTLATHISIFAASLLPLAAMGQDASKWPEKNVSVVVPFPPGGSTDTIARILSTQLQVALGKSFKRAACAVQGGCTRPLTRRLPS